MNFTADLVAQALTSIEMIKKKVCRVYSDTREDIFNVNIKDLPEWSILYKMLFDTDQLDDYTFNLANQNAQDLALLSEGELQQAAKF